MSGYDEAMATMAFRQAADNAGDAGIALANRIRNKSRQSEQNARIDRWEAAVNERDQIIRDKNDDITVLKKRVGSLVERSNIWEERAVRAESAEDAWKKTMREMIDGNNVNLDKDGIVKKFNDFFVPDVEKRNQAMLSKRQ